MARCPTCRFWRDFQRQEIRRQDAGGEGAGGEMSGGKMGGYHVMYVVYGLLEQKSTQRKRQKGGQKMAT